MQNAFELSKSTSGSPTGVAAAIRSRRSVKNFDPAHRMDEEEFRYLMETTLLSPTAFNIQNWRFVRVSDPEQRAAIRQVAGGQPQTTDAAELLVLCFDLKAWADRPARYWRGAPPEVQEIVLSNFEGYFSQPGFERDEGMRSCGLAAMSLMLTAKEMGYDSCPMTGFHFQSVADIIGLPADYEIAMMVAVGKSLREPWPRPGQLALDDVLVTDRF